MKKFFATVALLSFITLTAYFLLDVETEKQYASPEAKKTALVIEATETKFVEFVESLDKSLDNIKDDSVRARLKRPLQIIQSNFSNPYKNRDEWLAKPSSKRNMYMLKSLEHFSYSTKVQSGMGIQASFEDITRLMNLDPSMKDPSTFDMFVLFHEAVHVEQDNKVRRLITRDSAFAAYQESQMTSDNYYTVQLNREVDAISREIDLINLYLNNELKENACNVSQSLFEEFAEKASADTQGDREHLLSRVYMACSLYRGEGKLQGYPDVFWESSVALHLHPNRKIRYISAAGDTLFVTQEYFK